MPATVVRFQEYRCARHVQLNPPIELGAGRAGTRLIFEAQSVKLEGDRVSGG
jgi:hypothetical protein